MGYSFLFGNGNNEVPVAPSSAFPFASLEGGEDTAEDADAFLLLLPTAAGAAAAACCRCNRNRAVVVVMSSSSSATSRCCC